ncbi:MAG: hypothetical protein ABSG95_03030 [Solirubrobacteraceae bacterium]|jgi:hypothetical protein
MNRSVKQKLAAVVALAVLIGGGALAAVSATGQGATRKPAAARTAHRAGGRAGGLDLSAAASYLGVTTTQLQSDLKAGKSLAEVANATSGKSAAGLIEAIITAKKTRLQADAAGLQRRVTALVNAHPGQRGAGAHPFASMNHLGLTAANYLGIAPAQLQAERRSGKSLAEIASQTSGKSAGGLIEALVAAKKQELAGALAAGKLTQARDTAIAARLTKRFTAIVKRKPPARPAG